MRKKGTLVLIELSVMILVVAIAAAVCIGGMVWAGRTSKETAAIDKAYGIAQNAAELYRHFDGDLDRLAHKLGGSISEEKVSAQSDGYTVTVVSEAAVERLLGARITVELEGKTLAGLSVRTQEVAK